VRAASGESLVIAKAGKPLGEVFALDAPLQAPTRHLGFMLGEIQVPDDFDRFDQGAIERLFTGAA